MKLQYKFSPKKQKTTVKEHLQDLKMLLAATRCTAAHSDRQSRPLYFVLGCLLLKTSQSSSSAVAFIQSF